jgi:hypothetical protein
MNNVKEFLQCAHKKLYLPINPFHTTYEISRHKPFQPRLATCLRRLLKGEGGEKTYPTILH